MASAKTGANFDAPADKTKAPTGATAVLVLTDGSIFWGYGIGAETEALGEVCFNTSMTGYQEILTDPSYAGQIITFTFPHIGNVGTNDEDIEALKPAARGLILRANPTQASSWRSNSEFNDWLTKHKVVGIGGIDTRALTQSIRDNGAPNGVIAHSKNGAFDIPALQEKARAWSGLEGMDLTLDVTSTAQANWTQTEWDLSNGYSDQDKPLKHVVAIDYGAKQNILRCLASAGCKVTIVPAKTSAGDILKLQPDGVFLSNGPGDPAATGVYAVPVIQQLLEHNMPIFGICLGHQLLALAAGGKTEKLHLGHRGGNQPVKDLTTGKVEITSQNHGFCVVESSLPENVVVTHTSLFDGSNEGIQLKDKKAFSVQYHPESSPGPHDSHYLFERFVGMMA